MRVFTRYQPLRRKKRSPWPFFVLLFAAVGAGGGWWWTVHQPLKPAATVGMTTPPRTSRADPPKPDSQRLALLKDSPPIRVETNLSPAPIAVQTSSPVPGTDSFPRPVRNILEGQIALTRLALSPGSLDGSVGSRTRGAILAFQKQQKLELTGTLDPVTRGRLRLTTPPFTNRVVAAGDLSHLRPLGRTWLAKSEQASLDYESILELVAEASQSHPALIRQLNPEVNWTNVTVGTVVVVPDVTRPPPAEKASFTRIALEQRTLRAFDASTNVIAHFPCSVARFAEKRPVGELHVLVFATNPNYTFDPDNFPESPEARTIDHRLILQPGPNNPVGTVWIGLDRPGYGIHGTPSPDLIGRAESHGCFRLANWNAEYLLQLTWVGMPVYVEP